MAHVGLDISVERWERLILRAKEARACAYAPYSKFYVGAALLCGDTIYVGCNVECADYDGTHAEEAALAQMILGGSRSYEAIVVIGGLQDIEAPVLTMPCGKCRQKLFEFAGFGKADPVILLGHDAGKGEVRTGRVRDLLPHAFGPLDIGIDSSK